MSPGPPPGLCESCRHQKLVRNTRGSSFSLCELSRADPAFPRYPRLPVLECEGFTPRPATGGDQGGESSGSGSP